MSENTNYTIEDVISVAKKNDKHNDAKLIKKNKSHLHFIGTKNDFLWRMSFFYNGKIVIINPLSLFYNVMIQKVDTFVDKII